MEFDKSKVYTALNADESFIGARGYFANFLVELEKYVSSETVLSKLTDIRHNYLCDDTISSFNFFYLVEPAPEKWYVTYTKDNEHFNTQQIKFRCETDEILFEGTLEDCGEFVAKNKTPKNLKEHSKPKQEIAKHCLECDKFNTHCVGEYEGVSDGCNYSQPIITENWTIHNLPKGSTVEIDEPKYRPFKDCDDLIETYRIKLMEKYKTSVDFTDVELPSIWVKDLSGKARFMITCFGDGGVSLNGGAFIELNRLYSQYTFLDGSVCGVEE